MTATAAAHRPRVIVSGLPRSGTSWTAKLLAEAPGYSYYREPDNSDKVAGVEHDDKWRFLLGSDADDRYTAHLRRAMDGKIATPFTMRAAPGPIIGRLPQRLRWIGGVFPALYCRKPGVLVKFVRSSLALDWLAHHYPDARTVALVRHPVGQFLSYQKLGWQPLPAKFTENDRLMARYLEPWRAHLLAAETFWERAGAFWGAKNLVVHRQYGEGLGHNIVPFEYLCADPRAHFARLYTQLGLAWTDAAERAVAASDGQDASSAESYSLKRNSRGEIDKWQDKISAADQAACRRYAEAFELPFYADFSPWDHAPYWAGAAHGDKGPNGPDCRSPLAAHPCH